MTEILIPFLIFAAWTSFSLFFIKQYKIYQITESSNKKSFWNNSYIFESIPPVFPTLGIFCTALE